VEHEEAMNTHGLPSRLCYVCLDVCLERWNLINMVLLGSDFGEKELLLTVI
jgi:hypothetical protein